MTVRWKPLLILTGLFFVVAVIGVIAMVSTMGPRSAQGVLNQARASVAEGRFDNAELLQTALKIDPKNPMIDLEFADMYHDWSKSAPAEKGETIQNERTAQLIAAAKFDKSGRGPRTQLLEISMGQDSTADAVYWAGGAQGRCRQHRLRITSWRLMSSSRVLPIFPRRSVT